MRKLLFVLSLLFVADVCSVDAQQALLIRKKDKSRVGFPVSRIDAVKIASVDTLPESMFKNDTTYQYKTIRVSNIPSSVPSYTYAGAHIGLENQYAIAQTATAIPVGNSAAVYNGYMFVVADKLASVTLYDMRQNKQLAVCNLEPREDVDDSQSTVYSCAYASFGTLKYSTYDEFPLLYVSQRAKTGGKCFVTVLRVVPVMNANLTSCTSFSVQQVQTITRLPTDYMRLNWQSIPRQEISMYILIIPTMPQASCVFPSLQQSVFPRLRSLWLLPSRLIC